MKHIALIITALLLFVSLFLSPIHPVFATLSVNGFDPAPNGRVEAMAVQPDGKILLGGEFTSLGGQTRTYIGRLNADGSLDTTFNPEASAQVYALAVQPDGKILLGGNFFHLGVWNRSLIGRLNADGSVDPTFNPGTNGTVNTLIVQPDGKILVGGIFTTLAGQTRNYIGRLNADGSLDTSFNPGAAKQVYTLAVQPDGKILVGGVFTTLAGQPRNYIGRLNADGSLDTAFDPGANAAIIALALVADGKILVSGGFTTLGGGGTGVTTRNRIGRLNPDGSLDTSFNPGAGASNTVWSMAVQANGKILLGGSFSKVGGQSHTYIGRLNEDGNLDTTFNSAADSVVYGLMVQPDGKILVGGDFTTLGGQASSYLGQLAADTPALQDLTVDPGGTTITWMRSGSAPEVGRVTFEQSTDGSLYSLLGAGTRVSGGWQLSGLNLPQSQNLYIRARGYYPGGLNSGSTSLVESVLNIFLEPPDTADLAVTIHASVNPVPAGSPLTLTLTATNLGPSPAASAVLYITLPAGLSYKSAASGDGTSCVLTGSQLICQLGDLAASASQLVTLNLDVPRGAYGNYSISASLESTTPDPSGDNNAATILTVQPRSFLFLPLVTSEK